MKTAIHHIAAVLLAALALTACISDEGGTQPLNIKVQLTMPEEYVATNTAGRTVTLAGNEATYTAVTDESGTATFAGVIPDVYSVSASWTVDAETYRTLTGLSIANEEHVVSGNMLNQLLTTDATITLSTTSSVKRALLISKVYYAGSKDLNNRNYTAGQYIELFNNSEDTVSIAGLYIGILESNSTPAYTLGLTPDYIYLKQAFRFPDDASAVAPGGTVVITNSAIDHTVYGTYEKNLLEADFEAKRSTMVNNPLTPALELVYSTYAAIPNINFIASGPSSIVLFSAPADTVAAFESVYSYGRSTGVLSLRMPKKYVTDGVDCLKMNAAGIDVSTKRLYDEIDAGYTYIDAITGYNGQVVYRRIAETTADGRIVLQDTNNSSSDFATSDNIALRAYQ